MTTSLDEANTSASVDLIHQPSTVEDGFEFLLATNLCRYQRIATIPGADIPSCLADVASRPRRPLSRLCTIRKSGFRWPRRPRGVQTLFQRRYRSAFTNNANAGVGWRRLG